MLYIPKTDDYLEFLTDEEVKDFVRSVHFLQAPPPHINMQTVQAPPFQAIPPYILVFRDLLLKIGFFSEGPGLDKSISQ